MLEEDEIIQYIEEWANKHKVEVQENDASIEELQNKIK